MSPKEALAFVEKHGVVLQAARGSVPSLAEVVCESPDVLVCKLMEGRITYVHRRLWPALVKLASRFPRALLAKVWDEHTPSGAHRSRRMAFPAWVPAGVARQAEKLPLAEAEALLSPWLAFGMEQARPKRTSP